MSVTSLAKARANIGKVRVFRILANVVRLSIFVRRNLTTILIERKEIEGERETKINKIANPLPIWSSPPP